MKIDADLVLERRKALSWSQEELAIAAGLNLRTIQRIENDGTASLQSKKALASAFSLEASELDYKEKSKMQIYDYKIVEFDTKGWINQKINCPEIEKTLKALGSEGWELVSLAPFPYGEAGTKSFIASLKRPLVD